jgi:hypothetical protein
VPTRRQIEQYMTRTGFKKPILTLEELQELAAKHMDTPEDGDEAYVVSFETTVINEKTVFCIVLSTPKLRRLQREARSLQVDATYKINWNDYPIAVAGFSDANNVFYPTHLALLSVENTWTYERFLRAIATDDEDLWRPEVVMADGDSKITVAVEKVWAGVPRAMCFFHVLKNLTDRMRSSAFDRVRDNIMEDVRMLQLSRKPEFAFGGCLSFHVSEFNPL